jgi:hypothetical protein
MTELVTSGSVGGMASNGCLYPETIIIAGARIYLSLGMDSPESRSVQSPVIGKVVQFPEVGGLHHHYERLVA